MLEQSAVDARPDPEVVARALTEPGLWPWLPSVLVPAAARAADAGVPSGLIWHFQLTTQLTT